MGMEEWLGDPRNFFYCRYCGLVIVGKEFLLSEEDEKKRYLLHDNSVRNAGYVKYLGNFIENVVLKYLRPPSTVLDFGSGPNPVLADLLEERDFNIDCYDKHFAPNRDVLKTGAYDGIILLEVLEHLYDPGQWFRFFHDLLKPEGILIIRTQLHDEDRDKFLPWWYIQDQTHVCFFSERTFRIIAEAYSFSLISINQDNNIILQRG
ncbi:MAG: class I SAM-dependent methyltransferase [Spirochaetales bacterium]|nr:class I SAM-dependent methyltransferase [Spirochaetales bacterium]